jgi:disulfide bond formation protein DsbB
MINILLKFAHDFKYAPDREDFNDYYMSHPDYPSLNAITDTLDFFDIENLAAKVLTEQFDELPDKIITLIESDKGEVFVYILAKDKHTVTYIDEDNKTLQETREKFVAKWSKIVLVIDENAHPIKKTITSSKNIWLSIIIVCLSLIVFLQTIHFSALVLIYSLLSLLGLALSILIIQENFGLSNEITSKICGANQTDKGNCQTVLQSDGAKIYKDYTLSDACITFFTTTSILLLFYNTNLYFIAISLLSIPIIIYSIYYQSAKVKKWCPLCLGILCVLAGMIATTFIANTHTNFHSIINPSIAFFLALVLATTIWLNFKPIISGYFELKKKDYEHMRFKRNSNTFKALLSSTKALDVQTIASLHGIEIGEKTALHKISLFLSPSCGHCHTAFKEAYELYQKHPDLVKLSIYFNVNIDNMNNPYKAVIEIITENYLSAGTNKALELLIEWHIRRLTLEDFIRKFKIKISPITKKFIISHQDWCNNNQLLYTPIRIFNHQLMPDEYSMSDLKYFIQVNQE